MIISRTPLRMSFVGGGSDMRAFYREQPGAVLATTIDRYVFVTVNRKFDDGVRVAYSRTETVDHARQVEHPIVRAGLAALDIAGGVEITTVADIPAKGSGLGSSSAFTVGLLNALNAWLGRPASQAYLARESCRVEIDLCGEPIGKQDQYAVAYGGFNLIEFMPDEEVRVTPVISAPDFVRGLQERLIVFYTGLTRSASAILEGQRREVEASARKRAALARMARLAHEMKFALEGGRLEGIGAILHENWLLKRSLASGISTDDVDHWYEAARAAGADGGKILGAGGGGFLLFFAEAGRHQAIARALPGLRRIPVAFERHGSQIVYYNPAPR
jgi:D-glycero-alpha-D-manno-heptose-7-phosphate kinase